jgi:hypothetical protein
LGRVTVISIAGLDLWFNSSDHLPPHFHARRPGQWEIRVFFLQCVEGQLVFTMKWPRHGARISGKDQRALLTESLAHRAELLAEWEEKVVTKEVL